MGREGWRPCGGQRRAQEGGPGTWVLAEKGNDEHMREEKRGAEVSLPEEVTFALDPRGDGAAVCGRGETTFWNRPGKGWQA